MRCRVFPYEVKDGPSNMALDEALLEAGAEDPSCALLRTYGWALPTLSLGFFQPIAAVEADPRWRSVPIVRRPTGGGAIVHHHELTYALVMPAVHPLARPATALYHGVHAALASMLQAHGVVAVRRGPVASSPGAERPLLCFTDRDPEDLVCQTHKIVGSAQRRRRGAVLQHGSILLERSPLTPELPGLVDLAATVSDPRFWSEIVDDGLPHALGLDSVVEAIPEPLRNRAEAIEGSIYGNPAWNRCR
jgi:lipoate-protein ligase A